MGAAAMRDGLQTPTAIEYVDWLLKHMLRTNRLELAIGTRVALPGSNEAGQDGGPPCLPPVETVINRLKVLAGLTPMRCARPVEAKFEKRAASYTLVVMTRFLETDDGSNCTIKLRVRPNKG